MLLPELRAHRICTGVLLIIVLMGCVLATIRASGAEIEAIPWRRDYAGALEEARTKDRLLWIHFTGPWCPNCTRMEQESFPHPTIREHAQRFYVPLKLQSDVNQELALSLGLSGLPGTVIVAPSREVITVRQGYLGPGELDDLLRGALARHDARLGASGRPASAKGQEPKAVERGSPDDRAQPSHKTKTETQIALAGYCPVSLVAEKRLVQGQAEYTVTHEGRLYRFANLLTFNAFRSDPQRYVPVNSGNCPVTQIERGIVHPGNPRFGVLYQGHLFLCSTDEDRQRFLAEPARYAAVDVAEQGLCPHCLTQDGLEVPGDPRYELCREGRRYWFHDPAHREAFLSASPSTASQR
jgi:YHS domain-containing protein